jgi:hypothetical protein
VNEIEEFSRPDGAVDVLILNNDEPPALLRNEAGTLNNWLGVRLVGMKSNIDAVGARITYHAGDFERSRMKIGGGSYLSSHDPRIVLGIGKRTKIDWLEVKWPGPSGLRIFRLTVTSQLWKIRRSGSEKQNAPVTLPSVESDYLTALSSSAR